MSFEGPTMNGEYNNRQFFYMDAEMTPCGEYGDVEGITCATAGEVEEMRGREVEVGLSWKGRLGWEEDEKWRDIVYLNLEPGKWLGVELFFTPVVAEKKVRKEGGKRTF